MQSDPKKPEVVYRRTPDPFAASSASERGPGYPPAIAPLMIGFLLLLVVILVLGWKSANKTDDVVANTQRLTLKYSTELSNLLEARLQAFNLDRKSTRLNS